MYGIEIESGYVRNKDSWERRLSLDEQCEAQRISRLRENPNFRFRKRNVAAEYRRLLGDNISWVAAVAALKFQVDATAKANVTLHGTAMKLAARTYFYTNEQYPILIVGNHGRN